MKRFCLYVLVAFIASPGFSQNQALFNQGKEQYKAQNYQEAIQNWNKIIENGEHSAALYFNLGNAHYELNNIGPSIYYYEKALQLDPTDTDIKTNLAFAENAKVDIIEPLPKTFFARWDTSISTLMSYEGWAWTTVIGFFVFVVLFLGYYFAVVSKRKRLFFLGASFGLLISILALYMAFRSYNKTISNTQAIIFAEVVEIKAAPTMRGETIFSLHEGTKVTVLEEEGDWQHIELLNGKKGWIPNSDLKKL